MATVTFSEAVELSKKEDTCVKHVTSEQHIALNPRFIGQYGKGIREQLNSQLNLYSERLGGVPIAFGVPKCRQRYANILDEQPFLHFGCEVGAIVFQPKIGSQVKGVVNKLGNDHVSCLVHQVFNAAIHRPRDINKEWVGSQLSLGQEVLLKLTKMNIFHGVVNIRAQLIEAWSKPTSSADVFEAETSVAENTNNPDESQVDHTATLNTSVQDQLNSTKKKHKDKRKSEINIETVQPISQVISKEDNESIGSLDSGLGALTPPLELSGSKRKHMKAKKAKRQSMNATVESEEPLNILNFQLNDSNVERGELEIGKHKKTKKAKRQSMNATVESEKPLNISNFQLTDSNVEGGELEIGKHKNTKKAKRQSMNATVESEEALNISNFQLTDSNVEGGELEIGKHKKAKRAKRRSMNANVGSEEPLNISNFQLNDSSVGNELEIVRHKKAKNAKRESVIAPVKLEEPLNISNFQLNDCNLGNGEEQTDGILHKIKSKKRKRKSESFRPDDNSYVGDDSQLNDTCVLETSLSADWTIESSSSKRKKKKKNSLEPSEVQPRGGDGQRVSVVQPEPDSVQEDLIHMNVTNFSIKTENISDFVESVSKKQKNKRKRDESLSGLNVSNCESPSHKKKKSKRTPLS